MSGQGSAHGVRGWLARSFAIDLRSLAAFRIVVGLLVLADLAQRSLDLVDHYTDAGLLPRAELAAHPVGAGLSFLSLHLQLGSTGAVASLFALHALAALALVVGYRSRAAAVVTWLLTLSLQNRNPLVHYGGDNFLALVLFWSLFLPLGARASLDARRGRGAPADAGHVLSLGSAGLLLQIAFIYPFSVFHKSASVWLPEGTAIFYALHLEQHARPLAYWLRDWHGLTRALTYGTWFLEAAIPLLMFAPKAALPLRMLGIASLVGFHVGIGLSLDLLLFSWISAGVMVVFLPAWFWDVALARRPRPAAMPWLRSLTAAMLPRGARLGASRPLDVAAAAALVFVLAWNVLTLRDPWREAAESHPVARLLVAPGLALRLGQAWYMFAPSPPRQTRWWVAEGMLADGRRVDLIRSRETRPSLDKPARGESYHRSGRWERVYTRVLKSSPYADTPRTLGRYYCRSWPATSGSDASLVALRVLMREERNRPGESSVVGRPVLRLRARCDELLAAPSAAGSS